MASTLFASRNEPHWGENKVYMRKNPNSSPLFKANPNPKKQIYDDQDHDYLLSQNHGPQVGTPSMSNNSCSLNQKPNRFNGGRESVFSRYVSFNITNYSKRELKDLKKRLVSELEQVRSLRNRIESRELEARSGYSACQFSGGYGGPEVSSVSEKKMKKISGFKRPLPPFVSNQDLKRQASESESHGGNVVAAMKQCGQILKKLMTHKYGYIFNAPVDAIGLKLHDYHHIIKNPMDLGTIKTKLGNKFYKNPLDFASDVRLTFNNALVYNPKGHEVNAVAEELLSRFERLFEPVYKKFDDENQCIVAVRPPAEMRRTSYFLNEDEQVRVRVSTPERSRTPEPIPIPPPRAIQPSKLLQLAPPPPPPPPPPPIEQIPSPPVIPARRSTTGRLPKPKAKDPNKREMTFEEKQKLSESMQFLPQEKMEQVVHIIKRRNGDLSQDGDEIEIDFEIIDKETLWELDRLVFNYKKMMNKMRRQQESLGGGVPQNSMSPEGGNMSPLVNEIPEIAAAAAKNKKGENVGAEEDVDIGEDILTSNFPPVEIEKDAGYGSSKSSSSSSSGSDSSSSSDSDSGSSSGSDSDANDVQSPLVERKASPSSS